MSNETNPFNELSTYKQLLRMKTFISTAIVHSKSRENKKKTFCKTIKQFCGS